MAERQVQERGSSGPADVAATYEVRDALSAKIGDKEGQPVVNALARYDFSIR